MNSCTQMNDTFSCKSFYIALVLAILVYMFYKSTAYALILSYKNHS